MKITLLANRDLASNSKHGVLNLHSRLLPHGGEDPGHRLCDLDEITEFARHYLPSDKGTGLA